MARRSRRPLASCRRTVSALSFLGRNHCALFIHLYHFSSSAMCSWRRVTLARSSLFSSYSAAARPALGSWERRFQGGVRGSWGAVCMGREHAA
eukprot:104869-Rhodomonas_salina.1